MSQPCGCLDDDPPSSLVAYRLHIRPGSHDLFFSTLHSEPSPATTPLPSGRPAQALSLHIPEQKLQSAKIDDIWRAGSAPTEMAVLGRPGQ